MLGVGLVYRKVKKSQLELWLFASGFLLLSPERALAGGANSLLGGWVDPRGSMVATRVLFQADRSTA
jgi:hypothetical protein